MSAKKKPENQIKALEKLIQDARTILISQSFMDIKLPDNMLVAVNKFLEETK